MQNEPVLAFPQLCTQENSREKEIPNYTPESLSLDLKGLDPILFYSFIHLRCPLPSSLFRIYASEEETPPRYAIVNL